MGAIDFQGIRAEPLSEMSPGLSALVVHDIKNQLNAQHELLADLGRELRSRGPVPAPVADDLHRLRENASRLQRKLIGFLTLYKGNEGQLRAHDDDGYPATVLTEAVLAMASVKPAHVRLYVDTNEVPASWCFDGYLVGLALESAIDNALRFARSRVRLHARERDGRRVFGVEDGGPGVREDFGEGHGAGVGTSLCRLVARLQAGSMQTAVRPGRWCCGTGGPTVRPGQSSRCCCRS
jgi:signal transduction histidine kinase